MGILVILITIIMVGIYLLSNNVQSVESKQKEPVGSAVIGDEVPSIEEDVALQEKNGKFYGDINSSFSEGKDTSECSNRFPHNGFKKIYRKNWLDSSIGKSEVRFENKTKSPVWIKLIHPTASFPIFGVIVYPMESVVERINIGVYGVEFSNGVKWCNTTTGIIDSKTLVLSKNLTLGRINAAALTIAIDERGTKEALIYDIQRLSVPDSGIDLPIMP